MFNNRQSRRRFRLGNLARLVQLRQSVSNQPTQPQQPPLPPKDLQEVLSSTSISKPGDNRPSSPPPEPKSSPAFQTQPQSPLNQFSSPSTFPPRPEPKSSPPSLLSPKSKEESPPHTATPPTEKPPPLTSVLPTPPEQKPSPRTPAFQPQLQSPSFLPPPNKYSSPMPSPSTLPTSFSISGENHPSPKSSPPKSKEVTSKPPPSPQKQSDSLPPSLTPEAKKLQSHPSTLNATLEYQSPPSSTPSKSTDETRFQSPSLLKSAESQPPLPPPETKTPPSPLSTLKAHKEYQPQLSPLSKSVDETRFQSFLPSQASPSKSGEHQTPLAPTEAKIPPLPPSFLESGEPQPPLAPPHTKAPKSTLNAAEEPMSQSTTPLLPSKATLPQSESGELQQPLPAPESKTPPPPPSLSKSDESQLPLPPTEAKNPQSTLDAAEEPQSPPLLPSIDKTRLQESPRPPLSPPSTLNTTKESTLLPPKASDETPSQSSLPWHALPPSLSETSQLQQPLTPPEAKISPPETKVVDKTLFKSSPQPPEAKITPPPPSTPQPLPPSKSTDETPFRTPPLKLNASKESHVQPLPPSKSTDPPSFPSIEEPKSTLRLPESSQQSRSHTHFSPPLSLTPKTTKNLLSQPPTPPPHSPTALTSPSQPQTKPNPIESLSPKPTNTKSHSSKYHNKDRNQNLDNPDAQLTNVPAEIVKKNRGNDKTNTVPQTMMIMFVNSNVQGINTSLSLHSSSIDHQPGVHLTIDSDNFSSTLF